MTVQLDNINSTKENFIEIYTQTIHRPGADKLLEYLLSSDFFTAPASSRFHLSEEGGLFKHSLNVYAALLCNIELAKERFGFTFSEESAAIAALLHDVCKIGCYKPSTRNVKVDGKWTQVPYYEFEDDIPYGHGEKSVYIISSFMKLTREEAFAIRYHMGFSDKSCDERNVGKVFKLFPLSLLLNAADGMATAFIEADRKVGV